MRNRFQTVAQTARHLPMVHVSRRLRAHGIRATRPLQRPLLLPHHRIARLQWARTHFYWTRRQWARVLFTDESMFLLRRHDGRIRCYRRRNERFLPVCIHEIPNRGYGQVMVWEGITVQHRTALVLVPGALTGDAYVANSLRQHVQPVMQQHNQTIL